MSLIDELKTLKIQTDPRKIYKTVVKNNCAALLKKLEGHSAYNSFSEKHNELTNILKNKKTFCKKEKAKIHNDIKFILTKI